MPEVLPKVGQVLELAHPAHIELELDGGIDQGNAPVIVRAGATILVAGASIFRKGDVKSALYEMRTVIDKTLQEVSA